MDLWDPKRSPEAKAAIEHWGRVQWLSGQTDSDLEYYTHCCDGFEEGKPLEKGMTAAWFIQAPIAAALLAWRRQGTDGPFR